MSKFVMVQYDNINREYFEVSDFSTEIIRELPFYKKDYQYFQLWEGEKRIIDGNILNIDGNCQKTIYFGKCITNNDARKIMGNDPKYNDVLEVINRSLRMAYLENGQFEVDKEKFATEYESSHYCLFVPPNKFYPGFDGKKIMSIEQFDDLIKLDYDKKIQVVFANTILGQDMHEQNANLLALFGEFFNLLLVAKHHFKNYNDLFNLYTFNFNLFNKNTKDEILEFLDYFLYAKELNNEDKIFLDSYKEFISKSFEFEEPGLL